MDMLIASAVFLCGIFLCMAMGWSLTIGLAFGLVCFTLAARRRGIDIRIGWPPWRGTGPAPPWWC